MGSMKFEIRIDWENRKMKLFRDDQMVQERSFTDKEDAKEQGRDFARMIARSSLLTMG
jgi:hypothetical protein